MKKILMGLTAAAVIILAFIWIGSIKKEDTLELKKAEPQITAETKEARVNFYTLNRQTKEKGAFLGEVEYKNGKIEIKDAAPQLEKILQSDFITSGGETEEVTLPSGRKFVRGGLLIQKPGTLKHLQAIIKHAPDLGYSVEVIEK